MNTSLVISPFKKALLISIYLNSNSLDIAKVKTTLMVVGLTTEEKVSNKAMPSACKKPLVTSQALFLSKVVSILKSP